MFALLAILLVLSLVSLAPLFLVSPNQNMAEQPTTQNVHQSRLINCPDCGTSISSSAFFCPKCGRPSSVAADRAKTQGCVMMLLQYVLFGLVFNETLKWILQ